MYIDTIKRYTEEELIAEEKKLHNLLMNLDQAYSDRQETILLVNHQLDCLNNLRTFRYGGKTL
jgi:hypothetical protein